MSFRRARIKCSLCHYLLHTARSLSRNFPADASCSREIPANRNIQMFLLRIVSLPPIRVIYFFFFKLIIYNHVNPYNGSVGPLIVGWNDRLCFIIHGKEMVDLHRRLTELILRQLFGERFPMHRHSVHRRGNSMIFQKVRKPSVNEISSRWKNVASEWTM